MDCTICTEKFNVSTRKPVCCPQCDIKICRECVTTYMLDSDSHQDHCMNCKKPWSRKFFASQMTKVFMNREYKRRREEAVFDLQKARLEATIPYVECKKRRKTLQNQLSEQWRKLDEIHREIRDTNSKIEVENRFFYGREGNTEENKKRSTSRGHCIKESCNGLVDQTWKCSTCETPVCNRCMKKREEGHICNEQDVQSMQLIRSDTKPCPKCGVRIHLIEGCNQMWCTSCNTAFNWRTMQLIRGGFFHNPHYAEFQIANGADGSPAANFRPDRQNMECVNFNSLGKKVREIFEHNPDLLKTRGQIMRGYLMRANYYLDYESDTKQEETEKRLRELRVEYLMNNLDEADFKTAIQRVDKAYSKRCETSAVYTMYGQSVRDILGRFSTTDEVSYDDAVKGIKSLSDYSRNCLADINGYYTGRRSAKFESNYYYA